MNSQFSFFGSLAALFYDSLSGEKIPPWQLRFTVDGRPVSSQLKQDGFTVFLNMTEGLHTLTAESPMYVRKELRFLCVQGELPVFQMTLFPQSAMRKNLCCCEGRREGLKQVLAILPEEDTMIHVQAYDPKRLLMTLKNRKKLQINGSVAAYQEKKQEFYEVFLSSCQSPSLWRVSGNYDESKLTAARICRIFGGSVTREGNYCILLPDRAENLLLRLETHKGVQFEYRISRRL